ncbi:MAG: SLC13 family permease [Candidatus Nanosalina sp.]
MFYLCFFIVRSSRFSFERRLRERFGVDRHWWVPLLALGFAFSFSIVGFSAVRTAFVQKFDIIVLIFSFGVMAEGLRESGFFRHMAYRIVERVNGNTEKLVLSMFVFTSAVTFFTSNDIVIYVLTPIIVAICFQAGIENTKPILLSQFIAANTLSMGLLIGSPTNLIVADSLGLGFFNYLSLMFLPALVAFLSSLLLLKLTLNLVRRSWFPFLPDLEFSSSFEMQEKNPEPEFTSLMRNWVLIFGFFVALVAVVTYLHLSLLWCAVPAIMLSLGYWHFSNEIPDPVGKPLGDLPYGIFFFGMTFFVFAEQFSRTGFVNNELVPVLQNFFQGGGLKVSLAGVFGSGILVNMFNDLPASALVAQILPKLELAPATETVLTQASLVGLNIGTYVTEIGALAGLIWFEEMRLQRDEEESSFPDLAGKMSFPGRLDLIRFGVMHFVLTGLVVSVFLFLEWMVLSGF